MEVKSFLWGECWHDKDEESLSGRLCNSQARAFYAQLGSRTWQTQFWWRCMLMNLMCLSSVERKMKRLSLAKDSPMQTRRPKPNGTNCSFFTRRHLPSNSSRNRWGLQITNIERRILFLKVNYRPELIRMVPILGVLQSRKGEIWVKIIIATFINFVRLAIASESFGTINPSKACSVVTLMLDT